jgi:hypothetical protein
MLYCILFQAFQVNEPRVTACNVTSRMNTPPLKSEGREAGEADNSRLKPRQDCHVSTYAKLLGFRFR